MNQVQCTGILNGGHVEDHGHSRETSTCFVHHPFEGLHNNNYIIQLPYCRELPLHKIDANFENYVN